MPAMDGVVATLIGDVVGSRLHPDRAALQRRLDDVLAAVGQRISAAQPVEISVGDEFQGVYARAGDALLAALLIRLELLPEIDALLQGQALGRGAVELGTPSQEVEAGPDGTWRVVFRGEAAVEGWNAQISLLTGRCAARLMLEGRVGVLRTLPPPAPADVARLRRLAPVLDVDWPAGATPGAVVAGLDPSRPRHAAFLDEAASLLRGAAYTAFDGALPEQPGHGGIGGPYAHVTAPLRRLVDRFGTEVCLALAAGREPDPALRAVLPELPALMAASDRHTHEVERAVVDAVEVAVLAGRVGDTFGAVVLDAAEDRATVVLDDLAVRARCDGPGLAAGTRVAVRLTQADPATRAVRFVPA